MGEAANTELEAPDILSLSDEEFDKLTEPPSIPTNGTADDTDDNAGSGAGDDGDGTGDAAGSADAAAGAGGGEGTGDQADDSEGDEDDSAEGKKPEGEADKTPDAIDYKAEYEKLTRPFKANGGEIQVKDSDEILTLMQMGANYHKKMAALKPSIKLVKLLERHDLADESKLAFLIDLSKKDPTAIQKFIKESGIDPLDIDVAADSTYTPKVARVTDNELQLDEVLEDIQETPTYARTLKVVTDEWDMTSRQEAVANPRIISVINAQIANGIYDKVMSEVNRARSLGKLRGVTDFEAYKQIGDLMDRQGLLQPVAATAPGKTAAEIDAQKKLDEEKRNAKRAAAGAPPAKKGVAPVVPKSILDLPDEEFLKLPASAYTKIK